MTLQLPTHNVGAQVDEEDGDGANGHWDAGNDVDEEGAELSNVLGQGVGNGFLQVVKDQAAWGEEEMLLSNGIFYQCFPEKNVPILLNEVKTFTIYFYFPHVFHHALCSLFYFIGFGFY